VACKSAIGRCGVAIPIGQGLPKTPALREVGERAFRGGGLRQHGADFVIAGVILDDDWVSQSARLQPLVAAV